MLEKDTFCSIMNKLMCAYDADAQMEEIRMMYGSDSLVSDLSFLGGEVMELLAFIFGVDEYEIIHFCYELDFGRNEMASGYGVDSFEKYYDFLVKNNK